MCWSFFFVFSLDFLEQKERPPFNAPMIRNTDSKPCRSTILFSLSLLFPRFLFVLYFSVMSSILLFLAGWLEFLLFSLHTYKSLAPDSMLCVGALDTFFFEIALLLQIGRRGPFECERRTKKEREFCRTRNRSTSLWPVFFVHVNISTEWSEPRRNGSISSGKVYEKSERFQ